ncbi:hypothetical protein DPMN_011568 [Dreissena polymorpha]|uniref:Uncharacterized protein n=1 Tax=Dreissena polymorpha TaxID=45954 RepID=A0A9D4S0E3_DREPO|nr:hypothetical protein DPMN_011568 [Dreissena polymorpha]
MDSRVFTRKTAPPTGGHVFQRTRTSFELNQHIIKTNILTNFELDRDFIGTKLLTKFHEDRTINVASRVFTNKCGRTDRRRTKTGHKSSPEQSDQQTNGPTDQQTNRQTGQKQYVPHYYSLTETIFELNSHIKKTNAKNVTSRVFTCFHYIHIEINAPPTGGHVFSPIRTIVELVQDINKTNVLTNFHDDWAKIVTSRVFTRENCHYMHIKKNAPPTGGPVFSLIWTIFKHVRDINKINVLTNFHDDWTKIVTSRVFTRENCHIHIEKNTPPTGGHVFSQIWTIFDFVRDIN